MVISVHILMLLLFTMKDLEHIKAKLNADAKQVNLSAKITVNTGPNIQLTFGGSFRYANSRIYIVLVYLIGKIIHRY